MCLYYVRNVRIYSDVRTTSTIQYIKYIVYATAADAVTACFTLHKTYIHAVLGHRVCVYI